jgi:hypothetical protein
MTPSGRLVVENRCAGPGALVGGRHRPAGGAAPRGWAQGSPPWTDPVPTTERTPRPLGAHRVASMAATTDRHGDDEDDL